MDTYIGRGLHRSTVESLGLRIVSGEVAEGEALDVAELQMEFDISLTVIREALRVLAAKGLVEARQKRGTYVRPRAEWQLLDGDVLRWQFSATPTPGLFKDLNELRAIVEPSCARVAAERRTEDDLKALEAHLASMSDAAGDPTAEVDADLAFHQSLLEATHNELLTRLNVIIFSALAVRDRIVHDAHPTADPVPLHRAVLDMVRKGDADGAEQAMRTLITRSVEDLNRIESGRRRRPARSSGRVKKQAAPARRAKSAS